LKWEQTFDSTQSKIGLDNRLSIHRMFIQKSGIKADNEKINQELLKHNYINFDKLIVKFDDANDEFVPKIN
jgi:hypothetical protein